MERFDHVITYQHDDTVASDRCREARESAEREIHARYRREHPGRCFKIDIVITSIDEFYMDVWTKDPPFHEPTWRARWTCKPGTAGIHEIPLATKYGATWRASTTDQFSRRFA